MEMKTTKQIMVHNVKRAPNYWGKIRFFCFTTGPDEGPTGAETPLVAMLKEALTRSSQLSLKTMMILPKYCQMEESRTNDELWKNYFDDRLEFLACAGIRACNVLIFGDGTLYPPLFCQSKRLWRAKMVKFLGKLGVLKSSGPALTCTCAVNNSKSTCARPISM